MTAHSDQMLRLITSAVAVSPGITRRAVADQLHQDSYPYRFEMIKLAVKLGFVRAQATPRGDLLFITRKGRLFMNEQEIKAMQPNDYYVVLWPFSNTNPSKHFRVALSSDWQAFVNGEINDIPIMYQTSTFDDASTEAARLNEEARNE